MLTGRDRDEEDRRLRAYAHVLAADPSFQADADDEFAALVVFAQAVMAAGGRPDHWDEQQGGTPGSLPRDAAPP